MLTLSNDRACHCHCRVSAQTRKGKPNLVKSRVPSLRTEGLVTDRIPTIMRARDGTIIEVSEWRSQQAIEAAHENPNVLVMWNRFFEVCDCTPLNTLSESAELFAGFEPIPD